MPAGIEAEEDSQKQGLVLLITFGFRDVKMAVSTDSSYNLFLQFVIFLQAIRRFTGTYCTGFSPFKQCR